MEVAHGGQPADAAISASRARPAGGATIAAAVVAEEVVEELDVARELLGRQRLVADYRAQARIAYQLRVPSTVPRVSRVQGCRMFYHNYKLDVM